eukprot:1577468-Rhodomonas_salina.1
MSGTDATITCIGHARCWRPEVLALYQHPVPHHPTHSAVANGFCDNNSTLFPSFCELRQSFC